MPSRIAMKGVYEAIDWLGAVSHGDAERWRRLGVPEESLVVTGDTRHDQVLERATELSEIRDLLDWGRERTTLVAGSTDLRDERVLFRTFSRIPAVNPAAGMIVVPHESGAARIEQTQAIARRWGIKAGLWQGRPPEHDMRCVVVAKTGVLADIYLTGEISYVGGGFHSSGLHSVAEPAAYSLPVLFGPVHGSNADAELLLNAGGAIALNGRSAENDLYRAWLAWLDKSDARAAAGLRARGALRQGAAKASAAALLELLGTRKAF